MIFPESGCALFYRDVAGCRGEDLLDDLTEGQKRYLERDITAKRREEYIFSRSLYNRVVYEFLGGIPVDAFPEGAPHAPLSVGADTFFTSLSHSGTLMVVAVARCPVSVDAEKQQPRDFVALGERVAPQLNLGIMSPETRARSFYRAWCEKECAIKLGEKAPDFFSYAWELSTPSGIYTIAIAQRAPFPIPTFYQIEK